MDLATVINRRELRRYLDRVGDRWQLEVALLAASRTEGAVRTEDAPQTEDAAGAGPEPRFVLVLVSSAYDGMPWLERVYQSGSLWDALEMGGRADIHCYTPAEFARKRETLPAVREATQYGIDLLAELQ